MRKDIAIMTGFRSSLTASPPPTRPHLMDLVVIWMIDIKDQKTIPSQVVKGAADAATAASNASSAQETKKQRPAAMLECPVCLEPFEHEKPKGIPRLFSCGHSVCHDCTSILCKDKSDGM